MNAMHPGERNGRSSGPRRVTREQTIIRAGESNHGMHYNKAARDCKKMTRRRQERSLARAVVWT
jgi:hypothetical protein